MRRKPKGWWLAYPPAFAEPCASRPWTVSILVSTATLLLLAGIIAVWLPEYHPVAWALVLFSSCHAAFLLVQQTACKRVDPPPSTPYRAH